jgi:hypothetical protein
VAVRKTTVYLPDHLKLRLEQTAGDQGLSEADVIRAALDAYTLQQATPLPRLPLFEPGEVAVITDWDSALDGFGED